MLKIRGFALTAALLVTQQIAAQQIQPASADHWTDEPYTERYTTMLFNVHPVMAREFQDFYATQYPDMTCESCHGDKAEQTRWEMPSDHLDALDPNALPERGSAPEVDFMYDVVTPLFSRLTGNPLRTDAHPDGVSCFSCHVEKGS